MMQEEQHEASSSSVGFRGIRIADTVFQLHLLPAWDRQRPRNNKVLSDTLTGAGADAGSPSRQ